MTLSGQDLLYPLYMHVGIFPATAMPDIQAELEHRKPVVEYLLAEFRIDLSLGFCFRWQVEHNNYPHNTIGI